MASGKFLPMAGHAAERKMPGIGPADHNPVIAVREDLLLPGRQFHNELAFGRKASEPDPKPNLLLIRNQAFKP